MTIEAQLWILSLKLRPRRPPPAIMVDAFAELLERYVVRATA